MPDKNRRQYTTDSMTKARAILGNVIPVFYFRVQLMTHDDPGHPQRYLGSDAPCSSSPRCAPPFAPPLSSSWVLLSQHMLHVLPCPEYPSSSATFIVYTWSIPLFIAQVTVQRGYGQVEAMGHR